jgi:hypothetical protein
MVLSYHCTKKEHDSVQWMLPYPCDQVLHMYLTPIAYVVPAQIVYETFLEDVNNILTSGEVSEAYTTPQALHDCLRVTHR